MKNKALGLIKKPEIIPLVFIILLSIFLRTYHFSDWLHFELDQSRDAKVIDWPLRKELRICRYSGPKPEELSCAWDRLSTISAILARLFLEIRLRESR